MGRHNRTRRGLRIRTEFEAVYTTGREEGVGVLVDISESGIRIEQASLQPKPGTRLRLYLFLRGDTPVRISGAVVRQTVGGFAAEYKSSDPEIARFLDDTEVILPEPGEPR